ncbi:uncharacterized protein LOC143275761 [Babylonia areolata]|uniref:uncharacterized protein LOC143275761 n=1 Tax=Babylonia areolata TaxID=304850 RepID=UPI003FD1DDF6
MALKPNSTCPTLHHAFIDMLDDFGLEQMVDVPTRRTTHWISSSPTAHSSSHVSRFSPDCPTMMRFTETQKRKQIPRLIPLYKKADWDGLRKSMGDLQVRIEDMKSGATTEELCRSKALRSRGRRTSDYAGRPNVSCADPTGLKYLSDIFKGDDSGQASKHKNQHQKSSTVGVTPLRVQGRLVADPREQADTLNHQFQTAFNKGRTYTTEEFTTKCKMPSSDHPILDDVTITAKVIHQHWPPTIRWKDANVTPVFKKGEQYEPANYSPVSLTSVCCKVLEHILTSTIMVHFEHHGVLNDRQRGFRRGWSCETQLLEFADELVENMTRGKQTDVLILDFAKAFDRINHSLLIHKFHYFGIRGALNRWIADFLRDWRQAVISTEHARTPSVSNPESLKAACSDHACFWSTSTTCQTCSPPTPDCFGPLQEGATAYTYQLHGHTLATVDSAKYAGVTITKDLSWNEHIDTLCSNANKTLGFLRHNLKTGSRGIKETALEAVQRRSARFVMRRYRNTSNVSIMIDELRWPSLESTTPDCPPCHAHQEQAPATAHSPEKRTQPVPSTSRCPSYRGPSETGTTFPLNVVEAKTIDTFVSRASGLLQ